MRHPSSCRAALAGLLGLVMTALGALAGVVIGPAGGAYAAPLAAADDPLVVRIDTISSVLPRSGRVEISGTVTNVSDSDFTRVNLHVFSSQTPLTDANALALSATLDPATDVGPRVTEPGTFDTVDTLAPGETADFSDSVPVRLLGIPDEPGVYWIGIHALGDGAEPRDSVADGRARTFIPLLPRGVESRQQTQETSILLPLRSRVWFDADGRIGGTERWARWLEDGGRLDALLDVADTAGPSAYTWLVDPAVLLALTRLAAGNPPRTITPDPSVPGQEPTQDPDDDEADQPGTLTPSAPVPQDDLSEADRALADAASAWMDRFLTNVAGRTVMTLPFGDLDVSAAVRNSPGRYPEALARGAQIMSQLSIPVQPALAPEDDLLSPEALAASPDNTVVLLGDNAFTAPPITQNSVVRTLERTVVVTSTGAEAGGPVPTRADDPVALRQRLLSEAALRLAAGNTAPVVMTLPKGWASEDASAFFSGLSEPWLDVVPVPDVAARSALEVPASSLAYSETDQESELDPASFVTATRATDASALLEQLLAAQTTIQIQVLDEVLASLSEQHRGRPGPATRATGRLATALRDDLGRVTIEAPPAVTLSSDSGPLGVTLVNGLDQPVQVQVRATSDGDMTLDDVATRTLGPNARTQVRLQARAGRPGIHDVRLSVTTADGTPTGSFDEVPIRAAQVSVLIWVVMGVGAVVLAIALGFRLPRQIRARRRERAAEQAAEQSTTERETDPGTGRGSVRPALQAEA